MYLQLSLIFALACVLSQAEPHFGHGGGGIYVEGEASNGRTLVGDWFRSGANMKNQIAEMADGTINRIRGLFHKKGQSNSQVGFQTGYSFQAFPYGNQPPLNVYGGVPIGGVPNGGVPIGGVPIGGVPNGGVPNGGVPNGGVPNGGAPNGGANFGYNIGIVPVNSYGSNGPAPSSGNLGGQVNVGVSKSSVSGSTVASSLLGTDHLEYVSATGERRPLSYEEVVELITIIIDSKKVSSGAGGAYVGGYAGVPAGGYASGYVGVPAGTYSGAAIGGSGRV